MNEELQSANEELETINEEMRGRSNELNRANSFLESILAGLRDGVIVLDHDMQILAWNYQSEDLWGLRADEVLGKHLLNLDIGLPSDEVRGLIRACLATNEPQETRGRGDQPPGPQDGLRGLHQPPARDLREPLRRDHPHRLRLRLSP